MTPADNYFIAAGQNSTRVINKILTGLEDIEEDETAVVFADGTFLAGDTFDLTVTEAYIDMLRWWSQFNAGDATREQGTQVLLSFDGIPDGLSIESCAITAIDGFDGAAVVGDLVLSSTTIDADDNTVTVTLTTTDLTDITDFTFECDDFVADDDELPFATGAVLASASLAPDGDDLDGSDIYDDPDDEGEVPRYNETFGNEVEVLTVVPATTTLLVPFATSVGAFDTGLSVANTTMDPFGDDGAGGQDGTITFWLFPTGGDMVTWETSDNGEVGTGSDDDGIVERGDTFSVNVSEILTDAEFEDDFNGFIFIETQFTHAHGQAFITDYAGFASAANVLVLDNPLIGGRPTDESLGN